MDYRLRFPLLLPIMKLIQNKHRLNQTPSNKNLPHCSPHNFPIDHPEMTSANSTANSTLDDRHVLSTHPALNGVQLGVGLSVVTINLSFLSLLFHRRKRLQWKRYAFVANTALADAFGGFALLITALFSLTQSTQSALQLLALYTILAASLSVTVESYDILILVQYLAIRHPIWYKTLVTRFKLGLFFCWIWILNPGYATLKTCLLIYDQHKYYKGFMIYEVCFLLGTCLWNTSTYFYVLSVAARKKSQLHVVKLSGTFPSRSSTSTESDGPVSISVVSSGQMTRHTVPNGRRVSACQEFLKRYRFLATAGLSLVAYWISLLPIMTVYVCMLVSGHQVYFSEAPVRHIAILMWFFRSLCDPLIYMAREKKLRWRSIKSDLGQAGHQSNQPVHRCGSHKSSSVVSLNPSACAR